MPKRTNEFQKVIHSIYLQLHKDATVQESRFLVDGLTGEGREVDVVIETKEPGEMLIGVECNGEERPADVGWVEEMYGKHSTLPTNRLVLVRKAGFYDPARRKAQAWGIEALTLAEAQTVDWTQVVGKLARVAVGLPHIRLAQLGFKPQLDASAIDLHSVLYRPDGTPQGSLREVADARLDEPKANEHLTRISTVPGDHPFGIKHTPPVGSYIIDNTGRRHNIEQLGFQLIIHVDQPIAVELQEHTFQSAQVAHGSFDLPDEQGLLTILEEEGKPLSADLRLDSKEKKQQKVAPARSKKPKAG